MERHLQQQQLNERERDKATPLFVYLFVWDRLVHSFFHSLFTFFCYPLICP